MMFKSRSYVYNLVVKASFELPGVKIPKHQIAHVQTYVFVILLIKHD